MRYEIRVDGQMVDSSKRVDHATRKWEATEVTPGQTKTLVDTKEDVVLMQEQVEIAGAVARVMTMEESAMVAEVVATEAEATETTEEMDLPEVTMEDVANAMVEVTDTTDLPEQKEKKAPKPRHNGDEVAIALHGKDIDEVGALTRSLYEQACELTRDGKKGPVALLTPAKRERDAEAIERAIRRAKGLGEYAPGGTMEANPGSGRMSLGLMIRKYLSWGVAL
jgi:hypothetical protein